MDKKGAIGLSYSQTIWILRLVWFGVALMLCLLIISMLFNLNFQPEKAEREILMQRAIYSVNGLTYFNSWTGRMEPSTVDLRKFNFNNLDKAMTYERDYMAANISLIDLEKNQQWNTYYNQRAYERLKPLTNLAGKGGVDVSERSFYILIKDGEEIHKGLLKFEVLMPRS